MCDTLFHTRLEWDDHKLSSDHLRKVGEQRRQFNPDLKDDEFELLDVIVIEDEQPEEIPVASKLNMLDDLDMKGEEEEDDFKKQEENLIQEDVQMQEEQEPKIESEINEDAKELDSEVEKEKETDVKEENDDVKEDPSVIKKEKEEKYNPANVVGRELVVKTGGYVCRICSTFMKNDEEADLHCQTASHYINFTTITKLHVSIIINKVYKS